MFVSEGVCPSEAGSHPRPRREGSSPDPPVGDDEGPERSSSPPVVRTSPSSRSPAAAV